MMGWIYSGLAGALLGALGGFIVEKQVYDSYRGAVEAVGKLQEEQSKRIAAQHQQTVEDLNAHWKAIKDRDSSRIATLRKQLSDLSSTRLIAPAASSSPVDQRVCYSREELNRDIGAAFERLSEGVIRIAEEGERAVQVATQCRQWAGAISP